MTLNATQLELPYFIPTSENVQPIFSALGTAKATPTADQSERNFATEAIANAQTKLI